MKRYLVEGSKPVQQHARDPRSATLGGTERLPESVSGEVLFDDSYYVAGVFRQVGVHVYKSFVQPLASLWCQSRILCRPVG